MVSLSMLNDIHCVPPVYYSGCIVLYCFCMILQLHVIVLFHALFHRRLWKYRPIIFTLCCPYNPHYSHYYYVFGISLYINGTCFAAIVRSQLGCVL